MESFGADARGVAGKLFILNFTRTHGTTQSEKTEKFRNAMYIQKRRTKRERSGL